MEVLEHSPGLSTFEDIRRNIIDVGFMGRSLFTDPPMSPNHRLYVALTWAKQRARRDKSKPEWKRKEGKTTDEWYLFSLLFSVTDRIDFSTPVLCTQGRLQYSLDYVSDAGQCDPECDVAARVGYS